MTPESEYSTVDNLIAGVPQTCSLWTEAVLAWPGIIFDAGVAFAAGMVGDPKCLATTLMVAGYHIKEDGEKAFSVDSLRRIYGAQGAQRIFTQIYARHAGHQAEWSAQMIKANDINSVTLVVPRFHLARAYMTMIEAMRRLDLFVPIIPVSPPLSPFAPHALNVAPDGVRNLREVDVVDAEVSPRMIDYSKPKADGTPGDVATTDLFMDYMKRLYKHPLVADMLMSGMPRVRGIA
jgi:hypothetical protein